MKGTCRGLGGLGVALLLLLLLLPACSTERAPATASLSLEREGWDTVAVDVQFIQTSLWVLRQTVVPRDTVVYLFDAAYDTLYAGPGPRIPLPDPKLGDREPLLVEVCGTFEAGRLCEQHGLTASPKRLRLDGDVTYPDAGSLERGRYDLSFVAERQAFGGDAWEPLGPVKRVEGYLLAYVAEHDEEAVRIPLARTAGRFDLSRLSNYDDFAYRLQSDLLNDDGARVLIDVYAGFRGQAPMRLTSIEKEVRDKTSERRYQEARHFAEDAAEQLLGAFGVDEADAYLVLEDWDFNRLMRTYRIRLMLAWRDGRRFFGRRNALEGSLEVGEDGRDPRFRLIDVRGYADEYWQAAFQQRLIRLDDLEHYDPEAEEAEEEESGLLHRSAHTEDD